MELSRQKRIKKRAIFFPRNGLVISQQRIWEFSKSENSLYEGVSGYKWCFQEKVVE